MKTRFKDLLILLGSIFISQLAGFVGSVFTVRSIPTWYESLNKPFFNPPNWLFAPVWTILYTLMGISLYLIIKRGKILFSKEVKVFLIQLVINALWSIVFFGLKSPGLAFFVILVLGGFVLYLIKIFYKINKTASYLLIPYLLWVYFASLLNLSIWYLNK